MRLRRTRQTILDMFKMGKKFIPARNIIIFIHRDGENLKILYKKRNDYYNLNKEIEDLDISNYQVFPVAGFYSGKSQTSSIEHFVKLTQHERETLKKIGDYLSAGYKYGKYLSLEEDNLLDVMPLGYHVMPWHKYNKAFLLDAEEYVNNILKNNEKNISESEINKSNFEIEDVEDADDYAPSKDKIGRSHSQIDTTMNNEQEM